MRRYYSTVIYICQSNKTDFPDLVKDYPHNRERIVPSEAEGQENVTFSVIEEELSGIKSRAMSDGTFMKAPNGEPTNLTERQWLQVRTQAFKEWFGDWEHDPENASKVVDENGEPLVVYHGSPNFGFTVFDKSRKGERDRGDFGKGFYFTPNRTYAASYALPGYWNSDVDEDKVYACFLNIRKPLQVQARQVANMARWKLEESEGVMAYTDAHYELEWNAPQNLSEIVVQESNQIKSATDNRGTFDGGNPDITFSTVNLDDYFRPLQEGELEVPVEKLYTMKKEPRKSIDNALRLMRMAAKGEIEKRAVVSVALADDGSYTIVDGNATSRALAELGAEAVRVKVVGKDTGSRLNNSAYLVQNEKPGADADGKLRTHGLGGLAGDAAVRRVFEQAEENLPLLEKLVDAAASKGGGEKMMRPANSENGLPTKKPSTAVDKAKRDYKGDISRVVDLIGGTVVMPSDGDFFEAIKSIKGALPEGAEIAKIKKLGFQDNAPRYKDVKVSVRFANGGIGEIILVEDRINEAKFHRGGHVIYEVTRELDPYAKTMPDVKEAKNKLDALSSLVYAPGVDAAALERAKSSASSALEFMQPSSKNLALTSGVMGIIKSPSSLSKVIIPDSVDSAAMPRVSLIQNISKDSVPNPNGDVNVFSASVTSQADKNISFSVTKVSESERMELRKHFFDDPYGETPAGWWVHGRGHRQDLDTGHVIQMTKRNAVGLQYGARGSVWYLRPKKDAFVIDATTPEGLKKIEDALSKGYEEDTLPSSMCWALEENGDTIESLAELFNPSNIVDSAGAYDDAEWAYWLWDTLSVDMVITEDGAVVLDIDAMEGAKVYDDTNQKDIDLMESVSWSVTSQAEGENSFSMLSMTARAKVMMQPRGDEVEAEDIAKRWGWWLGQLERVNAAKGDKKLGSGVARYGTLITLLEATRGVLPPALAGMGRLNKLMEWAAVYAEMVETGEIPARKGVLLKGAIVEKFVAKLQQKRDETLRLGMSEEEAREVIAELGAEKLEQALAKVAKECRARLDMLLKERAYERIMTAAQRAYPKKERGKKSPRGKMDSRHYREMQTMLNWMERDANDVAQRTKAIRAELDALDENAEDYTERRDSLEHELKVVTTYGNRRGMGVMQAVNASLDFVRFVTESRHAWDRKAEDEKARLEWYRLQISRNFKKGNNAEERRKAKQEDSAPKVSLKGLKGSGYGTMSFIQLIYSAKHVWGEAFRRKICGEVADATAGMTKRRNLANNAVYQAFCAATGKKGEREFLSWFNEFNKLSDSGLKLRNTRRYTIEMDRQEARQWVSMSKDERQARRREVSAEEEMEKMVKHKLPPEEAIPKLIRILDEMDARDKARWEKRKDKEKPMKVASKVKFSEFYDKGDYMLRISKNAAANALLLLQQEDYKHLIENEGFVPIDEKGYIIDRSKDPDTPIDVEKTLKPLRDFIGEEGVAFAYALQRYVLLNGKDMQRVYEERMGVPLAMKDDYWRGNFDLATLKETDDLTQLNGGGLDGGGAYGFLIDRVRHYSHLDWNNTLTQVFNITVETQNNYVLMSGISYELRRLLADKNFAEGLQVELGVDYMNALKKWINLIEGAQKAPGFMSRWLQRVFQNSKAAMALAALSGNVSVLVKQWSAIIHGMLRTDVVSGVKVSEAGVREFAYKNIGMVCCPPPFDTNKPFLLVL